MRYLGELKPFLRAMRAEVMATIRPILATMIGRHAEAIRQDAMAPGKRVQNEMARVAERITRQWPNDRLRGIATDIGKATSSFQKEQLFAQVRGALQINVASIMDKGIAPRIAQFAAENVSLIRSVQTRYLAQVEQVVLSGISSGARATDIAAELTDRFDVSETNAARIARDQIGKLNGQLNMVRQQQLGVTGFIWRTMHDARVREEHDDLDGKSFSWDDPPDEGIPGEPINCRCYPEPDFTDLLETE